MINQIHCCHPLPKIDKRGEEILLSIHKLATILGDHVANTDIHVLSLITDEEIDDLIKDHTGGITDTTSPFDNYYTKDDIDNLKFLTTIPEEYITEEELKYYLDGLIDNITKTIINNIEEGADLKNYYTSAYIDELLSGYATKTYVDGLFKDCVTKSYIDDLLLNYYNKGQIDKFITELRGLINNSGSGGSGSADGNSYVTDLILNGTTLVLKQTEKSDVQVDLSYLKGQSGGGTGGGSYTNYKYYSVSVYKAADPSVTSLNKPGDDYTFNYATGSFTRYPDGWCESPVKAVEAFNSNKCQVWISHNNLCDDGTSTGWTTPVKYYNIDDIINDAKDEAEEYYHNQLEDAASELNTVITDANLKLAQAEALLKLFEEGDISAVAAKLTQLEAEIRTVGWNIEGGVVTYMESLFDAINKRIAHEISETDVEDKTVKDALLEMMSNFIKLRVYDYTENGPITESYLKLMATQVLLSVLGGEDVNHDGQIDASEVQSAILDMVKDRIKLSIANPNGGASFTISLGADGDSEITADSNKFVITGDTIANAIYAKDLVIKDVSALQSDGTAWFGKQSTQFNPDGSGHTAKGAVKWDERGNTTIKADLFAESLTLGRGSFIFKPISKVELPDLAPNVHREFFVLTGTYSGNIFNRKNDGCYYMINGNLSSLRELNEFSAKKNTLYWLISTGETQNAWQIIEVPLAATSLQKIFVDNIGSYNNEYDYDSNVRNLAVCSYAKLQDNMVIVFIKNNTNGNVTIEYNLDLNSTNGKTEVHDSVHELRANSEFSFRIYPNKYPTITSIGGGKLEQAYYYE